MTIKKINIRGRRTFVTDSSQYLGEPQYTPGYEIDDIQYPAYRIEEAWAARRWGGNYTDLPHIPTETLDAIHELEGHPWCEGYAETIAEEEAAIEEAPIIEDD